MPHSIHESGRGGARSSRTAASVCSRNWRDDLRVVRRGFAGFVVVALLAALAAVWTTPFFSAKFVLLLSLQQVVNWFIYGLMGLMLLEVIYSWINPNSPMMPFVQSMNAPLLNPLRRIIPAIGGIDLTILVALILLRGALQLIGMGIASIAAIT